MAHASAAQHHGVRSWTDQIGDFLPLIDPITGGPWAYILDSRTRKRASRCMI